MSQLYLHNKPIESVFELLGKDENDITYSVGWALGRSRSFLRGLLRDTTGYHKSVREASIRLQHFKPKMGTTDIEILVPNELHLIVEAKRGWTLPGSEQLKKYARRLRDRTYRFRKILIVSECSPWFVQHHMPLKRIRGIPIVPVAWKGVARVARRAVKTGKHAEKRLLRELLSYLGRITTMQDTDSNWVYVVSLAGRGIDNVKRRRVYFHPAGVHGWPKEPPNYMAFRYRGKLQSIHHVSRYELIEKDELYRRGLASTKKGPVHFLYKLGPKIGPADKIPTGKIYANGRVWCMLDTLFTSKTIAHARDISNKRDKRAKRGD